MYLRRNCHFASFHMDYTAARQAMVDSQIRPNDVTDHRLLQAFETTPREVFLPSALRPQAYVEKELAVEEGRSLLTARDFSKLLQSVDINPGDLILDVASGCGYSTAVLAGLGEMVVAVESNEALATSSEAALAELDITNAAVITGDPVTGAESQGPFDVVILAALIQNPPETLLSQLKEGGRLATLLDDHGVARGVVFHKNKGVICKTNHFAASARQVLPGFEKDKEFVF